MLTTSAPSRREIRSVSRTLTGLMMLACLLTACTKAPAPPEPTSTAYQPPENARNATMIWSAEPGIDLFTPESILIRAAREADIVARYGGPGNTYLGFMDALDPDLHIFYMPDSTSPSIHGTGYARIQSIQATSDGFSGLICIQSSGLATRNKGPYRSSKAPAYAMVYEFSESNLPPPRPASPTPNLQPDTGSSSAPTADAADPNQPTWSAPTENLFDGWAITLGPLPDNSDHLCEPWGRTLFPDAQAGSETVESDSPPPTLPAYPGWPQEE